LITLPQSMKNTGKKHLRVIGELPGPRSRALRDREAKFLAPGSQAIAAYAGVAIQSGSGCELVDVDGNTFLDFAAGICVAALGYAHPRFVEALTRQLHAVHAGSLTTEARVIALESIASVLPKGIDRVQFYSGGSEAVESAIRLARAHTGRTEVLSFWGGFHGKTAGTLAQMGSSFKFGLGPLAPAAYLAPYADCARCPFRTTYPKCGLLCVDFARDKLNAETSGNLAAILVEPMQGTAGNIVPPPDFLPAVAALAREKGALLIADEMITGFGRTGKFFGVQHSNVQPDIMTIGKSVGAGFPVSGLAVREDISRAKPWSNPSFSSSSYGGNPLAASAVAASVGIIRDDNLVDHVSRIGAHVKEGFERLSQSRPEVSNVRGQGLFIGFDLVEPGTNQLWETARCQALFQALLRRGLLTMAYAPRVRINPPLILTIEQADEALEIFESALSEVK
jgi:4-aminobutyrate aminotransferase / (S)-3-amino-2-methylpropionate transaminase / 5-aminovalerate transaminase